MIGKAKAGLKTAHFGKNVRDLKQHILRVRRAIQDIENGKELLWLTQHQKKCAGLKIGGMLWMELRLQQSGAVQVIRQNW